MRGSSSILMNRGINTYLCWAGKRILHTRRELGAGDSRLQFARPVDLIVRSEAE